MVLTAGAFSGDDAAERSATVAELVAALDAAGSGAVVAGDFGAEAENGLVGVVRADPALSASVSTVDNVATSAGQISTVLALPSEADGRLRAVRHRGGRPAGPAGPRHRAVRRGRPRPDDGTRAWPSPGPSPPAPPWPAPPRSTPAPPVRPGGG